MGLPRVTNVYAICAFAALGGGLFGFDISSMSGVLGTQAYIRYFNNPLGSAVSIPISWRLWRHLLTMYIARWYHCFYARRISLGCSLLFVHR